MSTPAGDGLVGDAEIRVGADTDPAIRALQRFSRDIQGMLRDLRGRFASESRSINRQLANNPPTLNVDTGPATDAIGEFTRNTQGRLRDVRGRFISESRAINRHLENNPPTLTPAVDSGPALQQIDDFTRDAQTRLRDARGRFLRTGNDLGGSVGDGVTSGLLATVRERVGGALQSAMSGLQGAARGVQSNPYVAGIGAALAAGVVASALPAIGALLGGAVIAVGALRIIGIGAALLKDEPEVKKAAEKLKDTVRGIFERAAQPLKEPFVEALKGLEQTAKDVAPQIEQAFRTVAESGAIKSLTDGIDQLVKNALPGFLKLIQDTGPVFEGIRQAMADIGEGLNGFFEGIAGSGPEAKLAIEDLGKAIKFLLIAAGETVGFLAELYAHVRTTVTDVVGAFQWLYDQLIGNSIIPDLIDGAVRLFASLPGRAFNALGTLTTRIGERARAAGATLVGVVRERVGSAITTLRGMAGRAFEALAGLAGNLRDRGSSAGGALLKALREKISDAVTAVKGLPGRAKTALGDLDDRLYKSGRSLIQGFIDGIDSKVQAVKSAVSSLVASARGLFPGSPAKEGPFSGRGWVLYSGRAIGEGLAKGIDQRARMARQSAEGLVEGVVAATNELLGISSPSKVFAEIGRQIGIGFIKGLTSTQAQIKATSERVIGSITKAFRGRNTRVDDVLVSLVERGNKRLQTLAKERDKLAERISAARKFAADITSQAAATGSLGSIVSADFAAPKLVKQRMRDALAQIKAFTADVQKLAKKGVNKDLLRQILELGPEQGAAFAQALAGASKATIKQFNSLNKQISGASSKLGKTGADLLFDSGKKAAEGFLAGLKAQQKKIEQLMLDIAKGMQKAIRKALGIKSPSRVMAALGQMAVLGLSGGITATAPAVDRAMTRVADAVTSGVPGGLAGAQLGLSSMRTGGGVPASVTVVNQINLTNKGAIGSQMELRDWLVKSLDDVVRMGRLPAGLRVG